MIVPAMCRPLQQHLPVAVIVAILPEIVVILAVLVRLREPSAPFR